MLEWCGSYGVGGGGSVIVIIFDVLFLILFLIFLLVAAATTSASAPDAVREGIFLILFLVLLLVADTASASAPDAAREGVFLVEVVFVTQAARDSSLDQHLRTLPAHRAIRVVNHAVLRCSLLSFHEALRHVLAQDFIPLAKFSEGQSVGEASARYSNTFQNTIASPLVQHQGCYQLFRLFLVVGNDISNEVRVSRMKLVHEAI